jgi:TusA-related sulfurtransferase
MGIAREINLVGVPWPLSLLKCDKVLNDMSPGESLTAILDDPLLKEDLLLLLDAMPEATVEVAQFGNRCELKIEKR